MAGGIHGMCDGIDERDIAPMSGHRIGGVHRSGHPHDHREIVRGRTKPQRLGTRHDVALVGDPAAKYIVDQAALSLMLQSGSVLLDHPVHRQRGRGALKHHLRPTRVRRLARHDQPSPLL